MACSNGNQKAFTIKPGLPLTFYRWSMPQTPEGLSSVNKRLGLGGKPVKINRRGQNQSLGINNFLIEGSHIIIDHTLTSLIAITAAGTGSNIKITEPDHLNLTACGLHSGNDSHQHLIGIAVFAGTATQCQNLHNISPFLLFV
jgi:hypothetical protein